MKPQLEMSTVVPVSPLEVYTAWLDSEAHAAMTGGASADARAEIGAPFSSWDGYIRGVTLELEPGRRIVQAWRTTEFPDHAPDSRLEVLLLPEGDGTRVLVRHAALPEDQVESYRSGWSSFYFEPMQKHFGARKSKRSSAKSVAAQGSAKPSSTKSPSKKSAKKSATKPASKTPAKKSPAKKLAKKSSTKKSSAKKSPAKKSPTKKSPAKKSPTKKLAKKSSTKKPAKKRAKR
jgi:uncharacterized protein YndB with AHSA1/START domain